MPITPTYPGVYIEELPSGVRTITGTATSITAFVGRAKKGAVDEPVLIQSFADYERKYGGLWDFSPMSFAVQQYFLHGGHDALIVRVINSGKKAAINLDAEDGSTLVLEAACDGSWGDNLRVSVDFNTQDKSSVSPVQFNLLVQEYDVNSNSVLSSETFRNLSVESANSRFITNVLEQQSTLLRVKTISTARPSSTTADISSSTAVFVSVDTLTAAGDDGSDISDTQYTGTDRKGIYALDKADLFNILCVPPRSKELDVESATLGKAAAYCKSKRAMLIIDPPITASAEWSDVDKAKDGIDSFRSALGNDSATNAAVYFPILKMANSLKANLIESFVPCGAVAGVWARTDSQRGVWKAPAGQEASLSNIKEFTYKLTDAQNGTLNQIGLNCLRSFPVYGNLIWGARTLVGADQLASEWKYIPVRRTALFIEESLYRGTKWVVFEPNDEPLWAQIRLNIGAFMHDLFRKGAFQGTSPKDAYFVKCDKETTTQTDIDHGIVNIAVGFAPLKPAEFVIIQIQQMAGNIQT
jgi:uncharacterized protein